MNARQSGLGIDTLLSIPEAAELARVPERTMRRRLMQLDRQLRKDGRARVLQRNGKDWKVRLEALRAELRTVELAEQLDTRMDSLESRVEDLDVKQERLCGVVHAEKRRQEKRWAAQSEVNAGLQASTDGLRRALEGMSALVSDGK